MIFTIIVTILLTFASLTIAREYRRARNLTLLSVVSVGNLLYTALTPALFYYSPASGVIFEKYVTDAGMEVQESGLTRMILAAAVLQFVCLCVSVGGSQKKGLIRADVISDKALLKAAIRVG